MPNLFLPEASATGWLTCMFCLEGGSFTGVESPCVSKNNRKKIKTGFWARKSGKYVVNFTKNILDHFLKICPESSVKLLHELYK